MAETGLKGNVFLCRRIIATGSESVSTVVSSFSSAEEYGKVPIATAITTSTPPGRSYLYDRSGTFQSSVAADMDACSPVWQIAPIIVIQRNYTGAVPLDEFLSLFTNKVELEGGYNYYFYIEGNPITMALVMDTTSYYTIVFNSSTLSILPEGCPINFVIIGGNSSARIYWHYSFLYTPTANTYRLQNGAGYDATEQNNSVWLGPLVSKSSDSGFNDILEDDFVPPRPATDPYSEGGESDVGGGSGTFDGTSVDVDFATLPRLSAADTGFITLYNPTLSQLQSLASYMWSGAFDLDTFKKLFADPMQAILGLSIVPGPVPSAGTQAVKVGNISTGISMTKAASQYIDVDCGTLNVEEFWGAYLDYEPYTKAEIYLPYIGTHQIAVDDIMGKAVHIKYHIDILSGACAAEIKCGGSVLYTFIGSVAVSIPVTGNDWTNVINGVLSIAGAVGSLVATGGAAAPAAAGEIASAAVNSLKPNIEKSGSVSGGGGLMAGKVPILILTRPRQALPASQNSFTGYPAFITRSLGAVSGYTEVHKIRLGGISATDAELDEIENLLKGGVIL